jgi:3-deoxy-D-manno-octulosonate 8-phosphate phosphatase (KDO 8-P phosphatase)
VSKKSKLSAKPTQRAQATATRSARLSAQAKIANPKSKILAIPPARWAAIRLFAMDVDGILTDGTLHISSDGSETKVFSVLDGMGLVRCAKSGIITAWISGRHSDATTVRAGELKIPHLIQGRTDKHLALQELANAHGIPAKHCAYMGDDDIDAAALSWAGIGITVPDAMPAALANADYITTRRPGYGAVREVIEHMLNARGLSFVP